MASVDVSPWQSIGHAGRPGKAGPKAAEMARALSSSDISSHGVWLYDRFSLSYRGDISLHNLTMPLPLPRWRPGFGGARLQSSDDIDHDRSVGGDRLLECRGDLARLLDTDATYAKAAGDRGKIGRPEAD